MKCFGLSSEDAQDQNDWWLRIMETTGLAKCICIKMGVTHDNASDYQTNGLYRTPNPSQLVI